jgi:histidyl-tRNA synthetase
MASKASLPRGTRDFLPETMLKREYVINILKETFRQYGFNPIETPALEKLDTLTGKYGEEGDRLIFKVLPRGDKFEKAFKAENVEAAKAKLNGNLEEALRYDLTVPFARFVVQNQNEIDLPFKRYQIQPVWRADRPSKGRFREFYQCDADVVGSYSLWQELDFIAIYKSVFEKLGLGIRLKMNHRKVLQGITDSFGLAAHFQDFTMALDKLDKIGLDGVQKEMSEHGLPQAASEALQFVHDLKGSHQEIIKALKSQISESEQGKLGIEDLEFVLNTSAELGLADVIDLDLTLARGLDYYTGAIFEVKAEGVDLGSIGGGGRYDDLTGIFGLKNLPGIGISFGLDRIILAMEEKELFPEVKQATTEILLLNFGDKEALFASKLAFQLRELGINTELYPDDAKIKKQLDYANKKGIRYTLMIGSKEIEEGMFTLKDMHEGSQQKLGAIELLEAFNPSQNNLHVKH